MCYKGAVIKRSAENSYDVRKKIATQLYTGAKSMNEGVDAELSVLLLLFIKENLFDVFMKFKYNLYGLLYLIILIKKCIAEKGYYDRT